MISITKEQDTDVYIIEGAGAGGRAMIFRCSSMQAVKHVAAKAPLAHATPLGNDMFSLGLIKR